MVVALPSLYVGDPIRYESLSVFPLFYNSNSKVEYRLSHLALADQSLLIEEVGRDGSVPDLLVENNSDVRVLFLEGEELLGAKQNRMVNTSVLVPAHSKIKIPVSCVEQGRWAYLSRYFAPSQSHSPAKLRRTLKASVSQSLKEQRGHVSDQTKVWGEVTTLQALHGVASETMSMSDTFEAHQLRIAVYQEALKYVNGATGLAVAIGEKVVASDLFDKPATCQLVWDRLLSGVVFDALEADRTNQHASLSDVEELLATTDAMNWVQATTVGDGEERRGESPQGDHASVLALEETVVHLSVIPACR